MKLSEQTVNVLKNFSGINQNILVKEGSTLRTMSTMKNILAESTVTESFPQDFGVYDLNEFLGVLTLVPDSELEFGDSNLTIGGGRTRIKYFYSDPSILTTPPEVFNAPECNVTFDIKEQTLTKILKASAVMQLPDVVMKSSDNEILFMVTDLKNTTSNDYVESLGATLSGPEFEFVFKTENLKMISGDYTVRGSTEAGVSNWIGTNVSYWIAMEAPID